MEGKVISFISPKGGVGKSTITVIAATALNFLAKDKKIAIIDGDFLQGSIYYMRKREEELYENDEKFRKLCDSKEIRHYDIVLAETKGLHEVILDLKKKYDYIFVDLPGTLSDPMIMLALLDINYLFIPVNPTDEFERNATMTFINSMIPIITSYQQNSLKEIRILFNMYKESFAKNTNSNYYDIFKEKAQEQKIKCFESKIYERTEIKKEKSTLLPLNYNRSKAQKNDNIYKFIMELFVLLK